MNVTLRLHIQIVMSTLGESNLSNEDISLKQIYFEVIETVGSEMTRRFDENNAILMAIEATNDFLNDDFDYNALQPLTTLKLTLPSREEMAVAKTFLLGKEKEQNNDETKKKISILQVLHPFAEVFRNTYRLFEAIETFGRGTTTNEASFSALSRIDTIRRRSMTDQRMRDLSFIAFEKKGMDLLKIDVILRKFAQSKRKVQLF